MSWQETRFFAQCAESYVRLLETAPWANKPATVWWIVLLLVCLFAELRVAVKIRKYALEKCLCSSLAAVARKTRLQAHRLLQSQCPIPDPDPPSESNRMNSLIKIFPLSSSCLERKRQTTRKKIVKCNFVRRLENEVKNLLNFCDFQGDCNHDDCKMTTSVQF